MVAAIIAVLIGVVIPVFRDQREKAGNVVDMHTAKTIADAITYYYIANPEALDELSVQCNKKPHYVQVSVAGTNSAIASILRPALNQAGLIGPYGTGSADRFSITCKSKTSWIGYRVIVSNYSGTNGDPGDFKIYYWGGVPAESFMAHPLTLKHSKTERIQPVSKPR